MTTTSPPASSGAVRYTGHPHPRTLEHLQHKVKPPKTSDERTGLNGRIGLTITIIVGTMWCAYLFTLIALVSLPSVMKQAGIGLGFDFGDGTVILIAWVAQTFLQLVLLPIIIVGQNIQARAADKRSEATYEDAKAVLHEAMEIQAHLKAQDEALTKILQAEAR
jgi:hypothetical protein